MMPITEIAACGLAAAAAVDYLIWLDSSLLATARAKVEAKGGRLAELAACRLCATFHAAWMAAFLATHGGALGRAAVAVLAIQRIGRLEHDLSPKATEPTGEVWIVSPPGQEPADGRPKDADPATEGRPAPVPTGPS